LQSQQGFALGRSGFAPCSRSGVSPWGEQGLLLAVAAGFRLGASRVFSLRSKQGLNFISFFDLVFGLVIILVLKISLPYGRAGLVTFTNEFKILKGVCELIASLFGCLTNRTTKGSEFMSSIEN